MSNLEVVGLSVGIGFGYMTMAGALAGVCRGVTGETGTGFLWPLLGPWALGSWLAGVPGRVMEWRARVKFPRAVAKNKPGA